MRSGPEAIALRALSAFVPTRLVTRMAQLAQLNKHQTGSVAELQAVLLLADISNFTTAADRIALPHREHGPEQVATLLQRCIEPMIEAVYGFDGEVASIRGDSLMAWWPVETDGRIPVDTALRCAAHIHAAFRSSTEAAREKLGVHIGVSIGSMLIGSATGFDKKVELVCGGPAVREACIAMNQAASGSTVVSGRVWSVRPDGISGVPTIAGYVGLTNLREHEPPVVSNLWSPAPFLDSMMEFMPEAVARLPLEDPLALQPSIRIVTALFCRIHEVDPSHATGMETIHALVSEAQRTAYRYGACMDRVNVDERGLFFIFLFGLPASPAWDRKGAAVDAAVELRDSFQARGFRSSIGLATGPSHCGPVGHPFRSHYTCHGVAPNLAARFMEFVDEGIVCDDDTACDAAERHDFLRQQPATLKGLPVTSTFNRVVRSHGPPSWLPLHARDDEVATLLRLALQACAEGRRHIVHLIGPMAFGKSALSRELVRCATMSGFGAVVLTGSRVPDPAPLAAWTAREVLPLHGSPSESRTEGELPLRPAWIAVLDAAARVDRRSIVRLREALATQAGVLELHLLRPGEAVALPHEQDAAVQRVELGTLSMEGIESLIRNAMGGMRPARHMVDDLHHQTAGHPLMASVMVEDLHRESHVRAAESASEVLAKRASMGPLPNAVRRAATALIDALPAPARHALLLLACADCECAVEDLQRLSPWPLSESWLRSGRDALDQAGLLIHGATEGIFSVGPPILVQVARRLLCEPQLRAIHERIVGQAWPHGCALASMSPMKLASHEEGAGRLDRAVECLADASERAAKEGKHELARQSLEALLRIVDAMSPKPSPERHAEWLARLGRAQVSLGDLAHGGEMARDALALFGLKLPEAKPGWLALALRELVAHILGRSSSSKALSGLHAASVAEAINVFTVASYFAAKPLPLFASNLLAVNVARFAGVPAAAARSAGVIGYMCGLFRLHGLADRWYRRTETSCRQAGDRVGEHSVLGGQAMYEIGFARWDAGRQSVGRAIALCRQAGDPDDVETALTLSGLLEHFAGDFACSLKEFGQVRDSALARQSLQHLAWGSYGMAQNLLVLGRPVEALPLLLEASEALLQVDDLHSDLICSGLLSIAYLHLGDYARASEAAMRAMSLAGRIAPNNFGSFVGYHTPVTTLVALWGRAQRFAPEDAAEIEAATVTALAHLVRYARLFPVAMPRLHMLSGWVAHRRRRFDQARQRWEEGLALAQRSRLPYDEGLLHWSLCQLPNTPRGTTDHQQLANHLFERCQAVSLLVEFGRSENKPEIYEYSLTT